MKPTKILIIIVTWNKKDYVIDLLNSLSALSFPREQLDILVIDNASNDGTVKALKTQFDNISLIQNTENLGGTGGFNTGLAWAFEQPASRYDYLWLLDNDVVVHKNALSELVTILETNADIAIAGSTMMQLDYPWRINEMGAFIDRKNGALVLNRHFEEIPRWQGKPLNDLLLDDADLSHQLTHCQPTIDVDYVAAASLLIRAPVAKQAGLWMDFFIHYDDVEWCLRIAKKRHRVVASAKSLIWHLSAIAKVPSWILYYDNRNILYLLKEHSDKIALKNSIHKTIKKVLYYHLLGKHDLAELHLQAITDFHQGITGKKDINLQYKSEPISKLDAIFSNPEIKKIIVPWTVNLHATHSQSILVKEMKKRPELQVYYLTAPSSILGAIRCQIPGSIQISTPRFFPLRYFKYLHLYHQFDLIIQSDYQPILPLPWIANKTLYLNDENFCLRPRPSIKKILYTLPRLIKQWRYQDI